MVIFLRSFNKGFRTACLGRWVHVSLPFACEHACEFVTDRGRLCRSTTGEKRNLSPDYPGVNFLAKDGLLTEAEITRDMLASLRYRVCPAPVGTDSKYPACDANPRRLNCRPCVLCRFTDRKLTTHQFLNRLPKVVVKAGQVIDVRDSLRATLQVSSSCKCSPHSILMI